MKFLFASDYLKGVYLRKRQQNFWQKQPGRYSRTVNVTALSLQTVAKVQQRQYLRLQMEKNYLCKFMDLSGRILQVIMACWMKIVQ